MLLIVGVIALRHLPTLLNVDVNASAAVTLLEQRPEKKFGGALSGIRTHDLCDTGAVLPQLSYQSHMRAVVYGLALYMGMFRLGPDVQ